MKRQWKLIFDILKYVESKKTNGTPIPLPEFDNYETYEVVYHVKLCVEAGYLDASMSGREPLEIICLTWDGHDKLDSMRENGCAK